MTEAGNSSMEWGLGELNANAPPVPSSIRSPYLDIDPSVFRNSEPVYIMPEGNKPERGRFELGFSQIGFGVLGGFAVGAGRGLWAAGRDASLGELSWTARRTQLLNYVVKHASATARPCGTVALFYAGTGTLLSLGRGGADDELNTLLSGALTGALFRSTQGPAKAAAAAAVGAAIAAAYVLATPSSRQRLRQLAQPNAYA